MPLQIGDTAVSSVYIGADPVSRVYIGSDLVWQAYAGAGMDKSGSQTLGGSTWSQITGWAARAGATVVNNGLVLPAGVVATAVVQVTYGGSNAVNSCRVLADGVVVGTAPAGGQAPTTTVTIPAAGTDRLITVEGYVAGLTGGRAVSTSGTFVTLS
ncbi:hypothetical protein CH298_04335 [Rhodococcoides fascians]|uniref:hypothetical protein n=1 Tax=Rhodococcoides fascians TaxID=1828 RepID=UPI000B9BDCBA|nr:hypothetical protein [Rhodococcus fascians]OZE92734.1 hypothetical protein CH303_04330 [Rhodococcus fascians]OZF23367.1 hypothetical protein CH298_04335 [Rhodococcus fascians]OZF25080.1 hypothetical protein CH297_04330 [Rhodococcus fascians]OZF72676.1 hypothetical protein CH308_04335 [Rhodococcus fascians]OZF73975.1 hypothetical protein CH307_04335 [Rhodococcus fascians]